MYIEFVKFKLFDFYFLNILDLKNTSSYGSFIALNLSSSYLVFVEVFQVILI